MAVAAPERRYLSVRYRARYGGARSEQVQVVSRREFLERYWSYNAGEHLTILAPTQNGKTTLAFQLLMYTASPDLPATVLVMKPRDPTPAAWGAHLGFPEVQAWPPDRPPPWKNKPAGHVLWPPHTFLSAVDESRLTHEFRACLQERYQHGDCIVFADEVYGLVGELDLTRELVPIWTRGAGMGTALWTATQRPAGTQGKGVPGFMYSNAHHLFLSKDPDEASRKRYGEIGGVDPRVLEAIVMKLKRFQFLYINRGDENGGPYMCVIEAR